jgi:hypothetical protein
MNRLVGNHIIPRALVDLNDRDSLLVKSIEVQASRYTLGVSYKKGEKVGV